VFRSKFSYSNSKSSYSDLLEDIETGKIESIFFYPRQREIDVLYKNGDKFKIPILYNDQLILEKATENKVNLTINNSRKEASAANSFASISLFLIFILAIVLILRSTSKLASRAFGFTKNQTKFVTIDDVDTRFDDVAGVPEAAEELKEVITFLKEPKKFENLGAKVPKGVLLIGPPGTGKTLLAKAIAGESGVPFLSISASEFVELFVGVGASRVRDLFSKAKEKSPCIIFIDEIDSIGRQRGSGIGGGNDEREQTLNQLLTELDGFADNSGIIVLAATNRPDILDAALLRPGRFDRKIEVMLPDLDGRKKILSVHSLSKPLSSEVDLGYWASRTVGFSGADLANLMNESAIHCARDESKLISDLHIENALDKITIGLRSSLITSPNMKKIIAYNEVGRAIVSAVRNGIESVDKITILPRSGSIGGYTKICPDEDVISSGLISKKLLFSNIEQILKELKIQRINGITFDFGVSSPQLENHKRGFSFKLDGPLDMRMGQNNFSASDFINQNDQITIENTLRVYGEEKKARQLSKAIISARPIETTKQLAEIIYTILGTPKKNKINPATKTFQAIRIAVNNELEEIKTALNASLKLLAPKGRILAVSFHSLEDRIVKKFFHENSNLKENSNRHLPPSFNSSPKLKIISKKPILPTQTELNHNIRSRSAKLRVAEKLPQKDKNISEAA